MNTCFITSYHASGFQLYVYENQDFKIELETSF